jgi:hypothetical protein
MGGCRYVDGANKLHGNSEKGRPTIYATNTQHPKISILNLHRLICCENEAILQLEEGNRGHKIEQLPRLPVFEDVQDPSILSRVKKLRKEFSQEERSRIAIL